MKRGKTILDTKRFDLMITRLGHEIIERNMSNSELYFVGIQTGGVKLARRIYQRLTHLDLGFDLHIGKLDITFFRDDYRRRDEPLQAMDTELDFLVEGKQVILFDDVLYTGRTIHAAMSALQSFGRANRIELMVLVDRRFNRHFPIQPDYFGVRVDTPDESYVRVYWEEEDRVDQIKLFSKNKHDD